MFCEWVSNFFFLPSLQESNLLLRFHWFPFTAWFGWARKILRADFTVGRSRLLAQAMHNSSTDNSSECVRSIQRSEEANGCWVSSLGLSHPGLTGHSEASCSGHTSALWPHLLHQHLNPWPYFHSHTHQNQTFLLLGQLSSWQKSPLLKRPISLTLCHIQQVSMGRPAYSYKGSVTKRPWTWGLQFSALALKRISLSLLWLWGLFIRASFRRIHTFLLSKPLRPCVDDIRMPQRKVLEQCWQLLYGFSAPIANCGHLFSTRSQSGFWKKNNSLQIPPSCFTMEPMFPSQAGCGSFKPFRQQSMQYPHLLPPMTLLLWRWLIHDLP